MQTPFIPADFATRPVYSDGMFLTSAVMTQEQSYFLNWLTLQTSLLYTAGVLTGLGVTQVSGNTLAIATGAGFDDSGNFLVVANAGLTVTVPASQASPSYVVLCAPPAPVASASVTSFNGAAEVSLLSVQPASGLLLAQISLSDGVVTNVTNLAKPVASRLGATSAPATEQLMASPAVNVPMLEGTVMVPAEGLTTPGQTVTQTVTFLSDGAAAFAAPPRVFVTPQSATAYGASVSDVTTSRFLLTMAAVTPASNGDTQPIPVHWLALI